METRKGGIAVPSPIDRTALCVLLISALWMCVLHHVDAGSLAAVTAVAIDNADSGVYGVPAFAMVEGAQHLPWFFSQMDMSIDVVAGMGAGGLVASRSDAAPSLLLLADIGAQLQREASLSADLPLTWATYVRAGMYLRTYGPRGSDPLVARRPWSTVGADLGLRDDRRNDRQLRVAYTAWWDTDVVSSLLLGVVVRWNGLW